MKVIEHMENFKYIEHMKNFKLVLRKFNFPLYREWVIFKCYLFIKRQCNQRHFKYNGLKKEMLKFNLEEIPETELINNLIAKFSDTEKIDIYEEDMRIATYIEAYCQLLDDLKEI